MREDEYKICLASRLASIEGFTLKIEALRPNTMGLAQYIQHNYNGVPGKTGQKGKATQNKGRN